MKHIILACGLFLFGASSVFAQENEEFKVAVTVRPLHSLAASLMQGTGNEPVLILDSQASPHHAKVKPSQLQLIYASDLVLSIGGGLEGGLAPFLNIYAEKPRQVDALALGELTHLSMRMGGLFSSGPHAHDHSHGDDEDHDHHEDDAEQLPFIDAHIWLSPSNAREIVRGLAAIMAQMDPKHAIIYQSNARRLDKEIAGIEEDMAKSFADIDKQQGFILFHDAFQYFEKSFGLAAIGAITHDPDQPPSGKHIKELVAAGKEQNIKCVFSEKGHGEKLAGQVADALNAKIVNLDPLGLEIKPGPKLYKQLMTSLAGSMAECLGQ